MNTPENNNPFSPQAEDHPAFAAGGRGQLGNPTPTASPTPLRMSQLASQHRDERLVKFGEGLDGRYAQMSRRLMKRGKANY